MRGSGPQNPEIAVEVRPVFVPIYNMVPSVCSDFSIDDRREDTYHKPCSLFHSEQASLDLTNFWKFKHQWIIKRLVNDYFEQMHGGCINPKVFCFNVFLLLKGLLILSCHIWYLSDTFSDPGQNKSGFRTISTDRRWFKPAKHSSFG